MPFARFPEPFALAAAVSKDGPSYGRQARGRMELFSDMSRGEVKLLEEKYAQALSEDEKDLLQEIKKIKGFQAYAF
ncbi:MAG: hypothetical protein V1708_05985 [Candidatus Micrarchaeota archaeon]